MFTNVFIYFVSSTILIATFAIDADDGVVIVQCPKHCQCYKTTVRCMFQRLQKIPKDIPQTTTTLDLRFNRIKAVNRDDLENVTRLKILLLNNNEIETIDDFALVNLRQLHTLHLNRNKLQKLTENTLAGAENLQNLFLNNNSITHVDVQAFKHSTTTLKRLYLNHNGLRTIPYESLSNLKNLERLRLDSNALMCDCSLVGLAHFLHDRPTLEPNPADCMYPDDMKGVMIKEMPMSKINCQITQDKLPDAEVNIKFGETVHLACKSERDLDTKVLWMHNDSVIDMDEDRRFKMLENGTLVIINPIEKDQGFYECMMKNNPSKPIRLRRAQLRYTSFNDGTPRVIRSPRDVEIDIGETIQLPCTIDGHPQNVEWSLDGKPLHPDHRVVILQNGNLVISATTLKDAGQYVCNAVNERGYFSATVKVHVRHTPEFTITPHDINAFEGSQIFMNCEVRGYPPPVITWTKDNRQLRQSRRVTLELNNTKLSIYPLLREDAGVFACHARNSVGAKHASGVVHIKASMPPKIVVAPQDQPTTLGSTVSFQCRASGEPTPRIIWMFNGSPVPTVRGHFEVSNLNTLYVHEVTDSDAGHYTCQAVNDVGAVTADAVLSLTVRQPDVNTGRSPGTSGLPQSGRTQTNLVNRDLIVNSIRQATFNVDRAINSTRRQLYDGKSKTPSELLAIFRFPGPQAIELARSREIYEQTLRLIQQHVSSGLKFDLSTFTYDSILSPAHLQLISELSGCNVHREDPNCNDMCFHNKYRTYDGTCNNLQVPMRGSSLTPFNRLLPPIYENGFNMPVGWFHNKLYFGYSKPNPRRVVTRIIASQTITPDPKFSHMLMQWGQFLDHDMDFAILSPSIEQFQGGLKCKKTCQNSAPCFNIDVPHDDPRIKTLSCIEMERSSAICGSGETSPFFNKVQPREQINQITSYIDASNVYGSTERDALDLRDLFSDHGLLKFDITSHKQKPFLPFNRDAPMDCRRNQSVEHSVRCFLAGDHRANEQLGLLAMHTLWLREHNRIAGQLLKINPHWDGEKLYQESRKIVGAQMQVITYHHWLPKILGPVGMKHIGEYKGYNPDVDSSIVNSFAAAAFRFGHTLIQPLFLRLNSSFQEIPERHILLHEAFFTPDKLLSDGGIDPLLRGLFASPAKLLLSDQFFNQELTEKLFAKAHEVALDLASLNIQRGRDHAIPGYTAFRKFCNLSVPDTFDELATDIPDANLRHKLRSLYGHPGNVDLFVGALSEKVLPDAKIGPTFVCIIAEQFKRLRDGDRFYFENTGIFTQLQQIELKKGSLAKVLCHNGDDIDRVQPDVFIYPGNRNVESYQSCNKIPDINLNMWQECCSESCSSSSSSKSHSSAESEEQVLSRYSMTLKSTRKFVIYHCTNWIRS